MTTIDKIMAIAEDYAAATECCTTADLDRSRQALRAKLEAALTPGKPVAVGYTLDDIAYACVEAEIPDSKFESLSIALEAAAPQPQPKQEPAEWIDDEGRLKWAMWRINELEGLQRDETAIEQLHADNEALRELLKEARKIIRASSSRNLAKDWDQRATAALAQGEKT